MMKILSFLGVSLILGCGDTKTLSVSYNDTKSALLPDFVVFVSSDLGSNFTQVFGPALNETTQELIYYYSSTDNLKNCVLAENLVPTTEGYHSGTATEANCRGLTTNLKQLIPPTTEELAQSGKAVKTPADGFVYTYFIYNSSATAVGADVAAGTNVQSGNRCFKLWGAKVVSGAVVARDGTPAQAVDLSSGLPCFGF